MKTIFINSNAKSVGMSDLILMRSKSTDASTDWALQTCWECPRITGFPLLRSIWRDNQHTLHHLSFVLNFLLAVCSCLKDKNGIHIPKICTVLALSISLHTHPTNLTIQTSTAQFWLAGTEVPTGPRHAPQKQLWSLEIVLLGHPCQICKIFLHQKKTSEPMPYQHNSICGCMGWHGKNEKCMCLRNLLVPLVQVMDFPKYCSQNRSDNAFTFATPFCLRFKDTLADDHLICWQKKHRSIKFSVPTRLRENLNTNLHCCCMRLYCSPSVLSLLRCHAWSAFLLRCVDQFLCYFCEPIFFV